MDFNDLKADWQNAGSGTIDDKTLKVMTQANQHPTLKKLRFKMMFEAVLLTILLFVYYDGFDGDKKPLAVNVLLVAAIACYITNNLAGYFFISRPVKANDILASVQMQVKTLKRLSVFSLIFSVIYAGALLAFFASSIEFTLKKYILLALMIVTASILFYISKRDWNAKIKHFEGLINEITS